MGSLEVENSLELILLELKTGIDLLDLVFNVSHLLQESGLVRLGEKFGWNWWDDGLKRDEGLA